MPRNFEYFFQIALHRVGTVCRPNQIAFRLQHNSEDSYNDLIRLDLK